jgi:hypothetical protein
MDENPYKATNEQNDGHPHRRSKYIWPVWVDWTLILLAVVGTLVLCYLCPVRG